MSDTILITASMRIERPVDVVRAQYRDIDHHIRNNVHPSIKYQWEPAGPGERKIRTTFRILGVAQFDVSLLEDAEDGSFVIRYLEGTNAGMVLVHKFVPLDGGAATDVQLFADAPATLGRKLLGPLFVIGARQVMKKALLEDKKDLEGGGFVPGRAAGRVEEALLAVAGADMKAVGSHGDRAVRAVIAAASIVAAVDGEVDASERDAINRLAVALGATALSDARWKQLATLAATEAIGREVDRIGDELAATGVGREGIGAGVVIGLVSDGLSLGELSLLRRMAARAKVEEAALGAMIEEADRTL